MAELPNLRVEPGHTLWESNRCALRGRFVFKAELSIGSGDGALLGIEELLFPTQGARLNVN